MGQWWGEGWGEVGGVCMKEGEGGKASRVGAGVRVQVGGAVQVLAAAAACLQSLAGGLGLPLAGCFQGRAVHSDRAN